MKDVKHQLREAVEKLIMSLWTIKLLKNTARHITDVGTRDINNQTLNGSKVIINWKEFFQQTNRQQNAANDALTSSSRFINNEDHIKFCLAMMKETRDPKLFVAFILETSWYGRSVLLARPELRSECNYWTTQLIEIVYTNTKALTNYYSSNHLFSCLIIFTPNVHKNIGRILEKDVPACTYYLSVNYRLLETLYIRFTVLTFLNKMKCTLVTLRETLVLE